ncbi:urocanate hydratase isoform X2 [Hydra vulgaris]|uniref:urocanate hydratase n=1 Tax=Hydra vulgaris TaxID=6087 RepID=A0ABM4DGK3_HYDVU
MTTLQEICAGLPLYPLPKKRSRDNNVLHAPVRTPNLSPHEMKLAVQNALRYFPENVHEELAFEFAEELINYGHIYMYRFQPSIEMKAYPIDEYPCKTRQAAAIMLMIMNNLDPKVAQFPNELITYGGNGHVFSNWAQFLIVMNYLSIMSEHQTLVMYSGHPMGLFPSSPSSPRAVITNGMVIPNYSSKTDFERMFALGVTMYGQMTAGSYCYIGPQGIVHGTTLTILNAGRKYLKTDDLSGKVFVTSGLGGMSGAQPKAGVITGCVTVVAEVSKDALLKRYNQGWLLEIADSLEDLVNKMIIAKDSKRSVSIGYLGNIVEVWEHLVDVYKKTGNRLVDLGSDQTSLHNPFNGGYYPVQLSFEESNKMMHRDPENFRKLVQESLRRHVNAVNILSDAGMYFWDYGNAFLLEASRAGGDVSKPGAPAGIFKYPTYVQDIMGDIFSMGFGPFRWVCTTGLSSDLEETDKIAEEVLKEFAKDQSLPDYVLGQINDNIKWIQEAAKHDLVVGSQARILYSDQFGRSRIAVAMNNAINEGRIKGPIVVSRDHHDVSGTDSPFRETSNIYDGSSFCADMAVQNCIGDSFRGATWVALHNGGGCGWGEVINGGFGLVLDGSQEAGERAKKMLAWDVSNGVARRAWCGHPYAQEAITRSMNENEALVVTKSHSISNTDVIEKALESIVK